MTPGPRRVDPGTEDRGDRPVSDATPNANGAGKWRPFCMPSELQISWGENYNKGKIS